MSTGLRALANATGYRTLLNRFEAPIAVVRPAQISLLRLLSLMTVAGIFFSVVGSCYRIQLACDQDEQILRALRGKVRAYDWDLFTGQVDCITIEGSVDAKEVSSLQSLSALQICDCWTESFNDDCLLELASCRSLGHVSLRNTKVTPDGIARFQQTVKRQNRKVVVRFD